MKSYILLALGCVSFGRLAFAQAGNDNPGGVTNDYHGSSEVAGTMDPYTGNGRREIDDIVVPGSIGAYPLKFTRTFTTRGGWSNSYAWSLMVRPPDENYCEENTHNNYCGPSGRITYPGGGGADLWDNTEEPLADMNGKHGPTDFLVNTGGGTYELFRADGGMVRFRPAAVPSSYEAYQIIDPYGQVTTLAYDTTGKLKRITEPGGRYLELFYQTVSYYAQSNPSMLTSQDLLSTITANDGQGNVLETVTYGYEWVWVTYGAVSSRVYNLTTASYGDGSQAVYTYEHANTDYTASGTSYNSAQVVKTCYDPRYAGPMKNIQYEYVQRSEAAPQYVARGQLKAEKNLYGQVVSQITFPASAYDPTLWQRTETRGDGPSRFFNYPSNNTVFTWTDFKNHTFTDTTVYTLPGWTVTDPRGNTTIYETEPVLGALRKITFPQTDPTGPATKEYTFYPGNPRYHSGEKDENGNWTYFTRDPNNHQVTDITHPDGTTEHFTYNNLGQVLSHTLTTGGTEYFEYDNSAGPATRGLKTRYTPPATPSDPSPATHPTIYTYYQATDNHPAWIDRLKSVRDPLGHTTAYEYNQRGQVTKVTHPDGYFTQSSYNPDGTLAWTADENHPNAWMDGHESERTRYTYDEYKRVRKVTNPMGETTETVYALDPAWNYPLLHTTTNPKYTQSPTGKLVVYEYDENLRKKYQGVGAFTADANETRFDYDEVGNLTWTRDPRMNVTTFGYDQRNRKTSMDSPIASDRNSTGHTMNWEYDGVGNKTRETRADNAFRSWIYDVPGRTTQAIDWRLSTSEPAVITRRTRDLPSSALSPFLTVAEHLVDAKSAEYTFVTDAAGRKIQETYPLDAAGVARTETWHYDAAGNADSHTTTSGNTNTLEYDVRNRLHRSSWTSNGTITVTDYDAASRVTSVETPETGIHYGYNDANRVVSEEQTVSGYPTRRIEKAPNADGNPTQLLITTGTATEYLVHYDYTQRNQLAHITQNDYSPLYTYTYDAAGNMTRRHGDVIGDSTNAPSATYDALNRPTYWEQTRGWDTAFSWFHYQYDNVGREVAVWRDEEANKGERFTFNTSNHLTDALYKADNVWTQSPANPASQQHYAYTPDMLNRASVTENGAVTNYPELSRMNQYTNIAGTAITYDGNFNLNAFGASTAAYDAQNQLTAVHNGHNGQFVYDGLGRCVKRTIDNTTILFVYDGWKPVLEYDGAGNLSAKNFYGPGPDEILLRWSPYGWFSYHADKQGSVTALVDLGGSVVEKYSYDAFGMPTVTSWNGATNSWDTSHPLSSAYGNRFMFTGRDWMAEFTLYDYRHRIYFPYIGRFLQGDPLGLQTEGEKLSAGQKALFSPGGSAPEAFSSSEMNLFRYCGDDPVDGSDPFGLKPGDPFDFPQDAARDVHNVINPTSINENVEYASVIYQVGDKFYASPTFSGTKDSTLVGNATDKSRIPENVRERATRVGDYHSHGDYSIQGPKDRTTGKPIPQRVTGPTAKRDDAMRGYNSDHASSADKERSGNAVKQNPGYRTFLGTPSKEFKEYNKKTDWQL